MSAASRLYPRSILLAAVLSVPVNTMAEDGAAGVTAAGIANLKRVLPRLQVCRWF